jgi:hypothetical protein
MVEFQVNHFNCGMASGRLSVMTSKEFAHGAVTLGLGWSLTLALPSAWPPLSFPFLL